MKRSKFLIALACLLIPSLITTAWFYSGLPQTKSAVMPDFPTIDLPKPPVSTVIPRSEPPAQTSASVLFDLRHNNAFTMTELDPLIRFIEADGGAIEVTKESTILGESLKSTDSFVCVAPIIPFTLDEAAAIQAFVKRGGKLVVITDPTRDMVMTAGTANGMAEGMATVTTSVNAANQLMEPYDISFSDDYLYNMVQNEGNFRNILISTFSSNDLTTGIKQLAIYGGHSVHSNGKAIATTGENTLSSANDRDETYSIMDEVISGSGSVLAIGDVSLITSQYVQSADNQVFVQNLANYLTGSSRQKTLADFPHIFSGDVVIQPAEKMEVNGELLTVVSSLEKSLQLKSGELTISKESSPSGNRILLSPFVSSDETKDILEKMDINLSPEPEAKSTQSSTPTSEIRPTMTNTPHQPVEGDTYETASPETSDGADSGPSEIEVHGLGRVTTDELGLVGLTRAKNQTTLVIMADTPKKIQSFLKELSTNGLSGCLIVDDLAACKVTTIDLSPQG
jgi:hypothetical protein